MTCAKPGALWHQIFSALPILGAQQQFLENLSIEMNPKITILNLPCKTPLLYTALQPPWPPNNITNLSLTLKCLHCVASWDQFRPLEVMHHMMSQIAQ